MHYIKDDLGRDDERRVTLWYDTLSDSYDKLYIDEQRVKHDLALDFLKGTRFSTLVDIGSGTGTFLRRAVHVYDYAIGVDLSSKMLLLAKREKPSSADLVRATSSMLPFRTGSVDGAVSISMVSAGEEPHRVVAELERIGKRNSVKVITVLKSPGNVNSFRFPAATSQTSISNRETLYFFPPRLVRN